MSLRYRWIILAVTAILVFGCAAPGQKFISIRYFAEHDKSQVGNIGVTPFVDNRKGMDNEYVGYRLLHQGKQQTYFVNNMDVSKALTAAVSTYLSEKGFVVSTAPAWEQSLEGLSAGSQNNGRLLAGIINRFECRAQKKGVTTHMVLDIDLTFILGIPDEQSIRTIPVALILERTEMTFSEEKLELFVNSSLEEMIQKALPF